MTKDEFITECAARGYAYKQVIKRWCKQHPKDEYSEEDMLDVYRYSQANLIGDLYAEYYNQPATYDWDDARCFKNC